MQKLKVGYFGTPAIAAELLQTIFHDPSIPLSVEFVVTQPDRPVGRKQILTPSAVKSLVIPHGIPVYTSLNEAAQAISHLDIGLVFAYGEIIPFKYLNLPQFGFWNIHPSLLPKYRGASPLAYALMMGETMTGVTLMKMDEKMDHGKIIAQQKLPIAPDNTRMDLEKRVIPLAYELLKKSLESVINNPVSFSEKSMQEQNHAQATYTRTLYKEDGYIEFSLLYKLLRDIPVVLDELPHIIQEYRKGVSETRDSSHIIFDLYRGLTPWPGIWTKVHVSGTEKRLKITQMAKNENMVTIEKVQLEGKNEVDFVTFNSAYQIFK